MFKVITLAAMIAIAPIYAIAQEIPNPATAPDPVVVLAEDWTAFQTAEKHLLSSIKAMATKLAAKDKEIADLKAKIKDAK